MGEKIRLKCPNCGSKHAVKGKVKKVGGEGGVACFLPNIRYKWHKFATGISVEDRGFLYCRECGLLSTRVSKDRVEKYIATKTARKQKAGNE